MNQLGKKGERIALKYLAKKGHKILEKNYRNALGEIDIISEHKQEIIFIEVKTRRSNQCGSPEEAVDFEKQKKIIKTASWYITKKRLNDKNFRFDVIVIYSLNEKFEIRKLNHIVDAFCINKKNNPFNLQQI